MKPSHSAILKTLDHHADTRFNGDFKTSQKQYPDTHRAAYNLPNLKSFDTMSKLSSKSKLNSYRLMTKQKNSDDLKSRLQTSWRKIYREILKIDKQGTGIIPCAKFV